MAVSNLSGCRGPCESVCKPSQEPPERLTARQAIRSTTVADVRGRTGEDDRSDPRIMWGGFKK